MTPYREFQAAREARETRHRALGAPTIHCAFCASATMIAPGLHRQVVPCEACGRQMVVTAGSGDMAGYLLVSLP